MAGHDSARREVNAELISIGTELLLGEIVDTNAAWIAAQLPVLGIPLYRSQQVGDNLYRLTQTLSAAWERADLLILTGGIGPTEDDLTREAIAELLGERMEVDQKRATQLRAFFAGRGRQMPERNLKQATLIPSARFLDNPIGTAPGWWIERDNRYIATMPGVPVEMRRMWSDHVVPRLIALDRGGVITKKTLKILGIGESSVEERLGTLVRGVNPTIATYAKSDGIYVRFAARAASAGDAEALLEPAVQSARRLFGNAIYGEDDDTLADSVRLLLTTSGERLSIVEAGSSGALCVAIGGDSLVRGIVLPPLAPDLDMRTLEANAVDMANRAAGEDGATTGVSVAVSHLSSGRFGIATAAARAGSTLSHAEEQGIDKSNIGQRSMLMATQLLRSSLLEA